MPSETHKYGRSWPGGPSGFTPIDIELFCFNQRYDTSTGALGPYRHFRNISRVLWPDMAWHQWAKDRISDLCEYRTNAWTGAGACGKTWDAGHFAMVFWLADPLNTSVILTSTTGDMVRKRIWPVIQELYHTAKAVPQSQVLRDGFPGNLVDSKTTLQAQKGDDKHGIFAKAVRQGSTAKAVADIQGIHSKRMLIVVDEATDTPEAMFEAIPNLRKGCEDFNLLVIGNPISHLDPHGLVCQPADGWSSITVESESWPTAGVSKWAPNQLSVRLENGIVWFYNISDCEPAPEAAP